jgi:N-acetylneuraminate synthase
MSGRVFIIAEAGVNHDGLLERGLALIDAAAAAQADAVKFQTFSAAKLVTDTAPKAAYQKRTTAKSESQYEMLRRLELSEDDHAQLAARCEMKNIEFMSTPFDIDSLLLLTDRFSVKRIKLGSGEVTNGPLLLAAARSGRPIILSTGMATMEEIEEALGVLAFGYSGTSERPSRGAFKQAYSDPGVHKALSDKVVLLHCTTEYPARVEDVNLRAMQTMRARFGVPVGYSDHTEGITIPVAATACGASVVEKHFTLSRNFSGPDHAASLEPDELAEMVKMIRSVEVALGDGAKRPLPVELANRTVVRKSIFADRPIAANEPLVPESLAVKRPETGRSPMDWWDLEGTPANRAYARNEAIDRE